VDKETKNWLNMVDYDLMTAKEMLNTGRFVYVVFMCHLAIAKALKAIICECTKQIPPKTHDLIYLVNIGKVKLSKELSDFIGMINNASVVMRYPEDLSKLIDSYPREVVVRYFDKTLEVIECIKEDPRLKE